MMTREEYDNAIQNVRGFDFENNLPTYEGDIGPYQNFMDIKDEYIQTLEHLLKGARGQKRDAEIYALSLEQKVADLETENERVLKALEREKEEHKWDRQIHERVIAAINSASQPNGN